MDIKEKIMKYNPYNEQEEKDKALILALIKNTPDIFSRSSKAYHITVSAWVTNREKSKVLMAYHNIYNSWAWLGGHADGETDLLAVALKEVCEESGLKNIRPVSEEIFSLEVLTVDGHIKKGEYVSSHLHLNITFLLEADEKDALFSKPDENSAVSWFTPDGALEASDEEWFKQRIYSKLNEKLVRF